METIRIIVDCVLIVVFALTTIHACRTRRWMAKWWNVEAEMMRDDIRNLTKSVENLAQCSEIDDDRIDDFEERLASDKQDICNIKKTASRLVDELGTERRHRTMALDALAKHLGMRFVYDANSGSYAMAKIKTIRKAGKKT